MDKVRAQSRDIGDALASISALLHMASTINDIEVLKNIRKFLTDLHSFQDLVKIVL